MTTENKESSKLDEGATKLDEGAAKLDEGAGKLREGATALHEVAVQMSGERSDTAAMAERIGLELRDAGAATLQVTRARAAQLHRAVNDSSARAMVLVKTHPLTALTTLGLAAAFIKVELAVGLLAGVASAALLINEPGPETRLRLASQGRLVLGRARNAWQARRRSLPLEITAS